jgi:phage I-like protein
VTLASLHTSLPLGDGNAPEWLHLIPAGRFKGRDGRGPYEVADPAALINASLPQGASQTARLPIDENHATDLAAPQGGPSPARGWIVALDWRSDGDRPGLYGRVEWNESGRQLMADRAYNGISPVFTHDKQGRVTQLLRAALTNTPNLDLATLQSRQDTMDLNRLRSALGLAQDADEAAIIAAIESRTAAHAQAAAQMTSLQAELTALKASAVPAETVTALQTQIASLQAEAARAKATAFVDGAIKAGKPIAPLRDHYIARHMADAKAVETEIEKLPSINAGGITMPARHDAQDGDDYTDMEAQVCKRMGLDPKKLAKHRSEIEKSALTPGMKHGGTN